jgi:hypothetical protein
MTLWILILVASILTFIAFKSKFEQFYENPTKSFAAEAQSGYLGRPSKCYTCERQFVTTGVDPGLAQPSKVFS